MSMSTHCYGIRPPDEKWKQMKAVYDACIVAGTSIPREVDLFFDGERPDDAGVVVILDRLTTEHREEMVNGLQLDLAKLPSDIKYIRFVNVY